MLPERRTKRPCLGDLVLAVFDLIKAGKPEPDKEDNRRSFYDEDFSWTPILDSSLDESFVLVALLMPIREEAGCFWDLSGLVWLCIFVI